jgi:DNA-binding CsgD family transcriptional regulator
MPKVMARIQPTVQFARTADEKRIGFVRAGTGPTLLYFRLVGHALREWEFPLICDWYRALAANHCLVITDMRNFGTSERGAGAITLETCLMDAEAVIARLQLGEFDVFADGEISPLAVALAARHPHRVRRMVLWAPGLRLEDWHTEEEAAGNDIHGALNAMAEAEGALALELQQVAVFGDSSVPPSERRKFLRAAVRPEEMIEYHRFLAGVDAWEYPDKVGQHTLSVHPRLLEWPTAAQRIAAVMPNGEYREVDGEARPYLSPEPCKHLPLIETFLAPDSPRSAAPIALDLLLTAREMVVLARIAVGSTNKEIAIELSISEGTVARHVANIYAKTGARNRAQATGMFLSFNRPGP